MSIYQPSHLTKMSLQIMDNFKFVGFILVISTFSQYISYTHSHLDYVYDLTFLVRKWGVLPSKRQLFKLVFQHNHLNGTDMSVTAEL